MTDAYNVLLQAAKDSLPAIGAADIRNRLERAIMLVELPDLRQRTSVELNRAAMGDGQLTPGLVEDIHALLDTQTSNEWQVPEFVAKSAKRRERV